MYNIDTVRSVAQIRHTLPVKSDAAIVQYWWASSKHTSTTCLHRHGPPSCCEAPAAQPATMNINAADGQQQQRAGEANLQWGMHLKCCDRGNCHETSNIASAPCTACSLYANPTLKCWLQVNTAACGTTGTNRKPKLQVFSSAHLLSLAAAAAAAAAAASHHLAARVCLACLLVEHLAGKAEVCTLVY
jgi:hypothetical protein